MFQGTLSGHFHFSTKLSKAMQLTYISVSMAVLPLPAATEVSQPSLATSSAGCRLCSWLHPAHWARRSVFSISYRGYISAQRSWPVKCKDLAVLLTPKRLWRHSNMQRYMSTYCILVWGHFQNCCWRLARERMGLVRHGCQCITFPVLSFQCGLVYSFSSCSLRDTRFREGNMPVFCFVSLTNIQGKTLLYFLVFSYSQSTELEQSMSLYYYYYHRIS